MSLLDWSIVAGYMLFMIALSAWLGHGQETEKDYYLGGYTMKWWSIGLSTMATQCSTNSLLGAPAFVAFSVGGGLLWLQYELAVPLAMVAIMIFTVVDSFTDVFNQILWMVRGRFSAGQYGYGAAMSWIYFLIIFAVIMGMMAIIRKRVFYQGE